MLTMASGRTCGASDVTWDCAVAVGTREASAAMTARDRSRVMTASPLSDLHNVVVQGTRDVFEPVWGAVWNDQHIAFGNTAHIAVSDRPTPNLVWSRRPAALNGPAGKKGGPPFEPAYVIDSESV